MSCHTPLLPSSHLFQNSASARLTAATQSRLRGSITSSASRSSVALSPLTSAAVNAPEEDDSSSDRSGSSRWDKTLWQEWDEKEEEEEEQH